jgi:shikimate dehydrogenase
VTGVPAVPRASLPPARLVLLGHPVGHARSPAMQGAALRAAGLSVDYAPVEVPPDGLETVLDQLARERGGGNVTIPHKEAVAKAAHRLTAMAARVGAVNTFWHDGDQLVGHNTDVDGARAALEAVWPATMNGAPVVVLGAGGSAAAVLIALAERVHGGIVVVARTPRRAEQLAARVGVPVRVMAARPSAGSAAGVTEPVVRTAGVVINATPIGQQRADMPVPPDWIAAGHAVLDLVYAPGGTAWVRACREAGRVAEDGTRMLVEQGAQAFQAWFGVAPDRQVMWTAAAAP